MHFHESNQAFIAKPQYKNSAPLNDSARGVHTCHARVYTPNTFLRWLTNRIRF